MEIEKEKGERERELSHRESPVLDWRVCGVLYFESEWESENIRTILQLF